MISTAPTCPHRANHMAPIMTDNTQLSLVTCPSSIPSSSRNPSRITIPRFQGLLMLDPVTWSAHDNRATMHHGGHLVGHPPCWQMWALRVPTLISCYSGLIYS